MFHHTRMVNITQRHSNVNAKVKICQNCKYNKIITNQKKNKYLLIYTQVEHFRVDIKVHRYLKWMPIKLKN